MIELEKKSKKKCCYQKNIGVESSGYGGMMLGFIHSSGHKEVFFSSFFTAIAYVWMFLWCNRKGYETFYAFIITFVQKNLIISHCCFHRLSNVRSAATRPHHKGKKTYEWANGYCIEVCAPMYWNAHYSSDMKNLSFGLVSRVSTPADQFVWG